MRTKQIIKRFGDCIVLERVTEHYTLRQDTPDGVIRHDGKTLWRFKGLSWYGQAPRQWDASKAVPDSQSFSYEIEVDYS